MNARTLTAIALIAGSVHAQEWTRFRGPNGSGVAESSRIPTKFGPEENALWKAPVPFASSSPVVTESAVVVTAATESGLEVLAFSRKTGEELWKYSTERKTVHEVFEANDTASPSPVTDGENVYAFFPELGLVSVDGAGKERWRLELGPFRNFYGMSSSPIFANDTVLLLCDQQVGSYMVAVDAATGKERWRADRSGIIESWTTPVVYPADDPREVIVFGTYFVSAYSIESGEETWRVDGFGYSPVCSPVLDGDRLYVAVPNHAETGLPDWATLAGMADADKDGKISRDEVQGEMADHFGWVDVDLDDVITEEEWNAAYEGMNSKGFGLAAIDLAAEGGPKELWRYKKALPSISSPLLYGGILYLARDGGLVTLIDAQDGSVIARERLPDGMGECWPSPIAADGKVFVANNAGNVAVVEAGPDWNVLGTNELGEDCVATPAIAGNALIVRTRSALWSFGEATSE